MSGTPETPGMSGIVQRDAWLQKHPSPVASRGEFHWYPDGVDRPASRGGGEPRAGKTRGYGRATSGSVKAALRPGGSTPKLRRN